MFATARLWFHPAPVRAAQAPQKPVRTGSPVFIGDAVQPWGTETLLLDLLRRDAADDADQS